MTDYKTLGAQAEALLDDLKWDITAYANISALLYNAMADINWAGFYFLRDGELQLGPFPGHIACDSVSASEIVVPIRCNNKIIGVLDIDSPVKGRFSAEDEEGLKTIVESIEKIIL